MNFSPSNLTQTETIHVNNGDRWQVYYRLQQLEIPCQCEPHQPLKVEINNVQAAIQLWSVLHHFQASRTKLIDLLNQCWQMKSCHLDN